MKVPSDAGSGPGEQVFAFGPFQLFRAQKILLESGRTVRLGSRALDLLIALVDRAGEVVSKTELMHFAWPDAVIEENNLRVHLAALRKNLGDGRKDARYIINIAGRGYSFIAPVQRIEAVAPERSPAGAVPLVLPVPQTRLVGRAEAVGTLVAQVPGRRLVTIVGPGGMGKTTTALAVAEQLTGSYERVCVIELSATEDASSVPAVLGTVVGVSVPSADPIAALVSFLRDKHFLIVLDNCEHVIDRVADLVERLISGTLHLDILATSREPLRAEGEYQFNLAPLDSPPESADLSARQALQYPAVELFVERADSGLDNFELTDANAAAVASLCRRLDGIPLAIELVAARVNYFGVAALAQAFGDDLLLTAKGKRTALSRHQSLRSALEWSYQILSPVEQTMLHRLAVFRGWFSAESAIAVAAGGASSASAADTLMSLVSKSLLAADVTSATIRYRLLHTTRAYALTKLMDGGERDVMLRRHAEYIRALLEAGLERWEGMTRTEWLAQYTGLIGDVRAAQEWAFSAGGDLELGAALTVAALPGGFQMAMIDETIRRATVALATLEKVFPPKPIWELRVCNVLTSLLASTGARGSEVFHWNGRALAISEQLGDHRYRIEPLTIQGAFHFERGNYNSAVKFAEGLHAVARHADDAIALLIADRLEAQTRHYAGDHERGRLLAEKVLRQPSGSMPMVYAQVPMDWQVSMRIILARILWMTGLADQAQRVIQEALERAAVDGPFAYCHTLAVGACPIAFWCGDLDAALSHSRALISTARRYSLHKYADQGLCYETSVHKSTVGSEDSDLSVADRAQSNLVVGMYRDNLATSCVYWIGAAALERAQQQLSGWATPEILRADAARSLRTNRSDPGAIEQALHQSLQIARQQQALAWELRSTMTLAQLWGARGRAGEALQILQRVYARFEEGHRTADLKAAAALIDSLQQDAA